MDMKKNNIMINKIAAETDTTTIVECDIIVPDVKPDLLKILQIDAVVSLDKKEIYDGSYSVAGKVDYTILYVPESTKGVCSLYASSDFVCNENHPLAKENMFMDVKADVEHLEFTLINSRKLNIKAVVGIDLTATDRMSISIPENMEGEGILQKKKNFDALSRVLHKEDEIKIEEELVLPPGKPTIESLLKSDVAVRNKDVKVIAGKVVVKGELVICNLYIAEGDGMPTFVEHCLPFTEIVDAQGITENNYNTVDFDVWKSNINASYDNDGDMRIIDCDIRIKVAVCSDEIVHAVAVTDAYSTSKKLNLTCENVEVDSLGSNIETTYTLKENITAKEGIPPISHIYNVVAKPYITECTAENGRVMLEGVTDTHILYISSKEDSPVYSFKAEPEFSISIDAPQSKSGDKVKVKLSVNHISYNLNAAGEIELRLVLGINISSFKKESIPVISDVSEEEFDEEKSPSIVLYFIQKDDTLWDIAKRYHTKAEYIQELNGLEDETLEEGRQLIIPKA